MVSPKAKATEEAIAQLKEAALAGDPCAQRQYGELCASGKDGNVGQDDTEAARWYRRAAEGGDLGAQMLLADCLATGRGMTPDEEEAAKWWQQAAEQGSSFAQHRLACMRAEGRGVLRDMAEAERLWRISAEHGFAPAQNALGLCLLRANRLAEAAQWLEQAAAQGDTDAHASLGGMAVDGLHPHADAHAGLRWLLKAAKKKGQVQVLCRLGDCYEAGIGVERSAPDAVRWYGKAAKQGSAVAKHKIAGRLLHGGDGIAPDAAQAVNYYHEAAADGYPPAAHALALLLLRGANGCALDPAAAALLLANAAQQGHEPALAALAEYCGTREVATACCVGCGATRRLHPCSECEVARFCGKECRQRVWPLHEEVRRATRVQAFVQSALSALHAAAIPRAVARDA
jgi:hypothetical protein